jgi:ubiquinone/menaquinone biosynthesis C-methylase UbiE/acyl carrier protein
VLDRNIRPVPIGVFGELYLGGDGLAQGYYNQPELTAEAFFPNPFVDRPDARIYRTGDIVRYLPNGVIQFRGRADTQVKIRGFRIEPSEIRAILLEHSAVKEAAVVVREDSPALGKQITAYIVPNFLDETLKAEKIGDEQVSHWRELYHEIYSETPSRQDETFNISGWNDSYTGRPIDPDHMLHQISSTVERLLRGRPARVLEIGCGTGLLLFRIAPHCRVYVGADFSTQAIDTLKRQVASRGLDHVELHVRLANELDGFEPNSFDLIIINSVVQYFPSVQYLLEVLDRAVPLVAPGGVLQIGDVRNLDLLEAHATSVELFQAPAVLTMAELSQRIRARVFAEEELLVAPSFFKAFQRRHPKLGGLSVEMKRGQYDNELTRFRYDVFLHAAVAADADDEVIEWPTSGMDLAGLEAKLADAPQSRCRITNIPNPRLAEEVIAMRLLASMEPRDVVGTLRDSIHKELSTSAIHPETLCAVAERQGFVAQITWSAKGGVDGLYTATLRPAAVAGQAIFSPPLETARLDPDAAWRLFGNNPLKGKLAQGLILKLRALVEETLPEYMRPMAYVAMDRLPLTRNGKLDYRALPPPDHARANRGRSIVQPRNPVEELVHRIWREALGNTQVGVTDNFFELGGHSLMATQIVARLRRVFQTTLPLRLFLEEPTIANVAALLETHESSPGRTVKIAVLNKKLANLSQSEVRALLDGRRQKNSDRANRELAHAEDSS